jgi:hypothetical protein
MARFLFEANYTPDGVMVRHDGGSATPSPTGRGAWRQLESFHFAFGGSTRMIADLPDNAIA